MIYWKNYKYLKKPPIYIQFIFIFLFLNWVYGIILIISKFGESELLYDIFGGLKDLIVTIFIVIYIIFMWFGIYIIGKGVGTLYDD